MDRFIYNNYKTDTIPILYIIEHTEDCPLHDHDYTELVLVLSGSGIHKTQFIEYPISAGDIFVIHKNQYHGYRNVKNLIVATIMFKYEEFFEYNEDFILMPKFNILFTPHKTSSNKTLFPYRMYLKPDMFHIAEDYVKKLEYEQQNRLMGHKVAMKAIFLELIINLVRNYRVEYNEKHKYIHNLSEIFEFIEVNYDKDINIKMLAKKAKMSYRNFQREFKRITQKSPKRYIIDKRLEKAVIMLKDKSLNITDIAMATGFSNSNYFARQFRMKFKMSPSDMKA